MEYAYKQKQLNQSKIIIISSNPNLVIRLQIAFCKKYPEVNNRASRIAFYIIVFTYSFTFIEKGISNVILFL